MKENNSIPGTISGRVSIDPDNELWRTMNEPDIDPMLADGLRSNREFAEWWVRQTLPGVELAELVKVAPNFTREKESWSAQSKAGRETDLHIVFRDSRGDCHAILTESKIVAPAGHLQPEDYSAYARWGESKRNWTKALTVLMAPNGYLARYQSAEQYDVTLSYERVHDAARSNRLKDLAAYLRAGITRYGRVRGAPRNPDDRIGGFWIQYVDLLRDENGDLYSCLRGRDRRLFDSSQRWFYFCPKQPTLGRNGVQIVHKICNRKKGDQHRSWQQMLSLHVPRTDDEQDGPPDWGGRYQWRPSAKFWIGDVPLGADEWMFFDDFDGDAARRVWAQISELMRQNTEDCG